MSTATTSKQTRVWLLGLVSSAQTDRSQPHCRRGVECRYDTIYASPELGIEHVDQLWDGAREAGGDLGLIRAVLRWGGMRRMTAVAERETVATRREGTG